MAINLKRSPRKLDLLQRIGTGHFQARMIDGKETRDVAQAELLANLYTQTKISRQKMLDDLIREGYIVKWYNSRGKAFYYITEFGDGELDAIEEELDY